MFKLNIECTKDINELHINFADGTSVITSASNHGMAGNKATRSSSTTPEVHKGTSNETGSTGRSHRKETFLDTDASFGGISQDIVELPKIETVERPVKVATELQNLDIWQLLSSHVL